MRIIRPPSLAGPFRTPSFGSTTGIRGRRRGRGLVNPTLEVVKAQFFDRKVLDALNDAERRALARIGSFIRKDAQRSMRKAKHRGIPPSPPGRPPRSRKGQLKRFLFYWYDPHLHDVVVGPILLGRIAVPGVHEHGGRILTKRNVLRYPARPFMKPALDKNLRKGVEMYRNSLRRR